MIAYATVTNTKRNLRALQEAGWRLLLNVMPTVCKIPRGFDFKYGIDNGAWSAYQQKTPWAEAAFVELLFRAGAEADWVVLPDIVAGGAASLERSLQWKDTVLAHAPMALLAVQNGMTVEEIRPHLSQRVGIFVGGDTKWKLETLHHWCALVARRTVGSTSAASTREGGS